MVAQWKLAEGTLGMGKSVGMSDSSKSPFSSIVLSGSESSSISVMSYGLGYEQMWGTWGGKTKRLASFQMPVKAQLTSLGLQLLSSGRNRCCTHPVHGKSLTSGGCEVTALSLHPRWFGPRKRASCQERVSERPDA